MAITIGDYILDYRLGNGSCGGRIGVCGNYISFGSASVYSLLHCFQGGGYRC